MVIVGGVTKMVQKVCKLCSTAKNIYNNKKRDKKIKISEKLLGDITERRIPFLYNIITDKIKAIETKIKELETNMTERMEKLEISQRLHFEILLTKINENTILAFHPEWFKGVRNAMRKELSLLEHVKENKIDELLTHLRKKGNPLTRDNFSSMFQNFNKIQTIKTFDKFN